MRRSNRCGPPAAREDRQFGKLQRTLRSYVVTPIFFVPVTVHVLCDLFEDWSSTTSVRTPHGITRRTRDRLRVRLQFKLPCDGLPPEVLNSVTSSGDCLRARFTWVYKPRDTFELTYSASLQPSFNCSARSG